MSETTPPRMHLVAEIEKCQGIGDYTVLSWKRGLIPFLKEFPLGTKLYAVAPGAMSITALGRAEIEKRGPRAITHTVIGSLPSGVTLDAATGKIHGNRNPRDEIRILASDGITTVEYVYPFAPQPKDFEL